MPPLIDSRPRAANSDDSGSDDDVPDLAPRGMDGGSDSEGDLSNSSFGVPALAEARRVWTARRRRRTAVTGDDSTGDAAGATASADTRSGSDLGNDSSSDNVPDIHTTRPIGADSSDSSESEGGEVPPLVRPPRDEASRSSRRHAGRPSTAGTPSRAATAATAATARAMPPEEESHQQRSNREELLEDWKKKAMSWQPAVIRKRLRKMGVDYSDATGKSELADLYARHKVGIAKSAQNNAPVPIVDPYADMPQAIPVQLVPSNGCWALTPTIGNDQLMSLMYIYWDDSALHSREYAQVRQGSKLIRCHDGCVWVKTPTGGAWNYRLVNQGGFSMDLYSVDRFEYPTPFTEVADCHNGIWDLFSDSDEDKLVLRCINYRYTSYEVIEKGINADDTFHDSFDFVGSSSGGVWLKLRSPSADLTPGLWFVTTYESKCVLGTGAHLDSLATSDNTGEGVWVLIESQDDIQTAKLTHIVFDEDEKLEVTEQVIGVGIEAVNGMVDAGDGKGVYIFHSGTLSYSCLGTSMVRRILDLPCSDIDNFHQDFFACGKGGVWIVTFDSSYGRFFAYVDRSGRYYKSTTFFP